MSLADFQTALKRNFDKYNGPFNWLVSECELGAYNYLSPSQKKLALALIYTQYFSTIQSSANNSTSLEKIYLAPLRQQEFFELIVCASLVYLHKNKLALDNNDIGNYRTPNAGDKLQKLTNQFELLKKKIPQSEDIWINDCRTLWNETKLNEWIDRQIHFLTAKTNAASNRPKHKDEDSNPCMEIMNFSDLSFESAQKMLDSLVGLTDVKRSLSNLVAHLMYDEARAAACIASAQPAFNNFILAGAPGVGKTTFSRIISGILAASGIIRKKEAIFTTASALIGQWIGVTEKRVTELFSVGRGGVIIIDEADTLVVDTKFHIAAVHTLNAMVGYEKDNQTHTVTILTGYESGIKALLDSNQGLRRRFPNHIVIAKPDEKMLRALYIHMLEKRGYVFESGVVDAALKQIMLAKDYLGNNFGNAGAVEEFIHVMESERARKIGISALQDIVKTGTCDTKMLGTLSGLTLDDVPVFDKNTKTFYSNHLTLVKQSD